MPITGTNQWQGLMTKEKKESIAVSMETLQVLPIVLGSTLHGATAWHLDLFTHSGPQY